MTTGHTRDEILSQADAWSSALDSVSANSEELTAILSASHGREARFIGSGSSYYLGLTAASSWSRAGWPARAIPSSEQLLNAGDYRSGQPPLVIAVTRSGSTTETVRAASSLKESGSPTIGISTDGREPIAEHSDVLIEVAGGRELSTVQTRSFSGHLVAAKAVGFMAMGDDEGLLGLKGLSRQAAAWFEHSEVVAARLANSFTRAYFLGTGERWGLAHEAALKLKESALTEAEAFQTLEFRHGPQSMVDSATLVVGLISDSNRSAEVAVLEDVVALGGQVLAIGEDLEGQIDLPTLSFRSGLPERSRSPLYLPPLQLIAYYRAVQNGLDPDNPRHLSFAVQLAHL